LLLAARCQHLLRKVIPRESYPMDRSGYRNWRSALAEFHAGKAGEILLGVGYPESVISRVGEFLMKKRLRLDPEVQLFEDAICLVFLELDLTEFSRKHDDTKMTSILRKTWRKMSPEGHCLALEHSKSLPPEIQVLLNKAIQSPPR
jgi:hypothetical protein